MNAKDRAALLAEVQRLKDGISVLHGGAAKWEQVFAGLDSNAQSQFAALAAEFEAISRAAAMIRTEADRAGDALERWIMPRNMPEIAQKTAALALRFSDAQARYAAIITDTATHPKTSNT